MVFLDQKQEILIPEQRVVFDGIPWEGYLTIHKALGDSHSSRLIYDRGILEISMPFEDHEFTVRLIDLLVRMMATVYIGHIKTMGSTRLDYPQLERGAEPDNAYYLANQPLVKGRNVDLKTDPPPDLVVEVDISPSKVDKLSLYGAMGIPEFWRFDGQELYFFMLQDSGYQEVELSPTFPGLPKSRLYQFLAEAREDEIAAEVNLRHWIQEDMK